MAAFNFEQGGEKVNTPTNRILASQWIIEDGQPRLATPEEQAEEQKWLDSIAHLPDAGYHIIARSAGISDSEKKEFFSAAYRGNVHVYLRKRETDRFGDITIVDKLMEFDRDNDETTLIGNRWLCKGKQAVLQGPTGVGKSSLVMQWSIRLCLGIPFFGINPVKEMCVMIIQAENDEGDMAEALQDMFDAMRLTNADVAKVKRNLIVINNDRATGDNFRDLLRHRVKQVQPDIVFVDPLLAYVGGDMLKQEVMSKFLRNTINPVLRQTGALLIWVHHIAKPPGRPNGQEASAEEKKYSGLGSSELQNTCREVITLSEVGDGLFELSFTKRGSRLGLRDKDGNVIKRFNVEHGKDGIIWRKSDGDKATADKKGAKSIGELKKIRDEIIRRKTMTKDELMTWASQNSIGQNKAVSAAKAMAEDKTEQENRIWSYKRPATVGPDGKKAKGEQALVFSIVPPPWEQPSESEATAEPKTRKRDEFGEPPTEEAKNPEQQSQETVKVKLAEGFGGVCATCTKCGNKALGNHESRAEPGQTKKYCLTMLKQTCPRGESNWYEVE